jgi:uncharacterized membrane protein
MSRKRRREAREKDKIAGPAQDPQPPERSAEWLGDDRIFPLALLVLLVATAARRMAEAWGTYLVPDEALILRIAQAPDFASVYRMATEQAHPPLYFLLLHIWTWLATSDFALRMGSILAATGAIGLTYAWMRRKTTPLAALGTASLLALSPSMVGLTLELRHYSLLLLFCSAALVAAFPPTGLPTATRMAATAGLLIAASATHYSGILFAVSLLGAMLVDLVLRQALWRTLAAHVASSLAVGLFAGILWWTHARELSGAGLEA